MHLCGLWEKLGARNSEVPGFVDRGDLEIPGLGGFMISRILYFAILLIGRYLTVRCFRISAFLVVLFFGILGSCCSQCLRMFEIFGFLSFVASWIFGILGFLGSDCFRICG